MIPFLKQFQANCRKFPEHPAVVDRDGARITSYQNLDTLSGRAAACLKERGIGREDMVAILLPKGMEHIAVRLAVMKVGAAWVSLPESMGLERARFAMDECKCRLAFDMRCWEDAMRLEPLDFSRWADPDPHDLAFVIYTSGSTGLPKGAMQEYGVYERISAGTHVMLDAYMPAPFAHLIPEYFVGGVYITVGLLQGGGTIHVISSALTRDLKALLQYYKDHEITATFTPPALARLLLGQEGLFLRIVFAGGEIVSQVWAEHCDTMNIYGPSEFGHPTCIYRIKSPMDNTPVGASIPGTETLLVSEDGREAESEGVLCVELPWFRGYVSPKDETRWITLRGRRWFYSGDYARQGPDGSYTILGRADSMININGNRLDTHEVETALKKTLGREHVAVKAFDRDGKPFLCAFYDGEPEPAVSLSARLHACLPPYMIPARFVHLEQFPINSAGKVDLQSLRLPEGRFAPYVPPETEEEKTLCRVMAQVLETVTEPVGIDDDFFSLGGDSVTAMRLILEAQLPGLDMALLYRGRSVRKIAEGLRCGARAGSAPAFDASRAYPLLPFQSLYAHRATLLNKSIAVELRFPAGTDAQRLARAVSQAVKAHSALWTVIRAEGENCVQCLDPRVPEQLFADDEAAFSHPFQADGSPLIRAQILNPEDGLSLRLNVHHIICDGSSFVLLVHDILSAYRGKVPEADDYPAYFAAQQSLMAPALREKEWAALQKRIGSTRWITRPSPDRPGTGKHEAKTLERMPDVDVKTVSALAGSFRVSVSSLFTAVSLLALGFFENGKKLLSTWTWNGRSDRESLHRVGLLLRDMPVLQELSDSLSVAAFVCETAQQRDQAMAGGGTAFLGDTSDAVARKASLHLPNDCLCFIYHDYLKILEDETLLSDYRELPLSSIEAEEAVEVHVRELSDRYQALLQYDASVYSAGKMDAFLSLYTGILEHLCARSDPSETLGELRRSVLADTGARM